MNSLTTNNLPKSWMEKQVVRIHLTRVVVKPSPGSTIPPGKLHTPLSRRCRQDDDMVHMMIKKNRARTWMQTNSSTFRPELGDTTSSPCTFGQLHSSQSFKRKQNFLDTGSRFQRVTTGSAAWFGPHLSLGLVYKEIVGVLRIKVKDVLIKSWCVIAGPAKHSSALQASPPPRVERSVGVVQLVFSLVAHPVHLQLIFCSPPTRILPRGSPCSPATPVSTLFSFHLILPDKGHCNQGVEGWLSQALVAKVGEVSFANLQLFAAHLEGDL